MAAGATGTVFEALSPETYVPHALHRAARDWPETNCYVDLWIELLHATAKEPTAALGFTAAQDFEGDHFTFFKFPPEDLALLYGVNVQELAIYDTVEAHLREQIARGRMVLVEVDGFYLPDTQGVSYRTEHTKTTIAVNRLDGAARQLDYFHNAGFFSLSGDDFDNLLRREVSADTLFPYVEFVKFEPMPRGDIVEKALALLHKHLARRPEKNPIAAFQSRIGEQAQEVAARPPEFFHKYAFNTLRQLGANFELLGRHLHWLAKSGPSAVEAAIEPCDLISGGAKTLQFQLARAVARKRFDGLAATLDPLIGHYERIFDLLSTRLPA